jgi:Zn-dependent peptidase ImmA (M78 family)
MNTCGVALSRVKIREIAKLIRKACCIENEMYFPIVHFIEWYLPEIDPDFSLYIVPEAEMRDNYGLTNTAKHEMRIREDVYKGACAGNPRDRFTMCHELGHYILHQPDLISLARGAVPKYCEPEWQANTFASELMVPYELAKGKSVEEIADECGMSIQAARIQYKICNKT